MEAIKPADLDVAKIWPRVLSSKDLVPVMRLLLREHGEYMYYWSSKSEKRMEPMDAALAYGATSYLVTIASYMRDMGDIEWSGSTAAEIKRKLQARRSVAESSLEYVRAACEAQGMPMTALMAVLGQALTKQIQDGRQFSKDLFEMVDLFEDSEHEEKREEEGSRVLAALCEQTRAALSGELLSSPLIDDLVSDMPAAMLLKSDLSKLVSKASAQHADTLSHTMAEWRDSDKEAYKALCAIEDYCESPADLRQDKWFAGNPQPVNQCAVPDSEFQQVAKKSDADSRMLYDLQAYLGELLRTAEAINEDFAYAMAAMLLAVGLEWHQGPIKQAARCRSKITQPRRESADFPKTATICDLVRGSVVCDTPAKMLAAVQHVRRSLQGRGATVVPGQVTLEMARLKNGLRDGVTGDYQDIKINVAIRKLFGERELGLIGEIQFVASPMKAYKKLGHMAYKLTRFADSTLLQVRRLVERAAKPEEGVVTARDAARLLFDNGVYCAAAHVRGSILAKLAISGAKLPDFKHLWDKLVVGHASPPDVIDHFCRGSLLADVVRARPSEGLLKFLAFLKSKLPCGRGWRKLLWAKSEGEGSPLFTFFTTGGCNDAQEAREIARMLTDEAEDKAKKKAMIRRKMKKEKKQRSFLDEVAVDGYGQNLLFAAVMGAIAKKENVPALIAALDDVLDDARLTAYKHSKPRGTAPLSAYIAYSGDGGWHISMMTKLVPDKLDEVYGKRTTPVHAAADIYSMFGHTINQLPLLRSVFGEEQFEAWLQQETELYDAFPLCVYLWGCLDYQTAAAPSIIRSLIPRGASESGFWEKKVC